MKYTKGDYKMSREDFIKKARESGLAEEEINEKLKEVDEAKAQGIIIPYDLIPIVIRIID